MPNKPSKYGLKWYTVCDRATAYCHQTELYTGKKQENLEEQQKGEVAQNLVFSLCREYFGSWRMICFDNWFSSVKLAQLLYQNQLTVLGTLKSNKVFF